MLQLVLIIY